MPRSPRAFWRLNRWRLGMGLGIDDVALVCELASCGTILKPREAMRHGATSVAYNLYAVVRHNRRIRRL